MDILEAVVRIIVLLAVIGSYWIFRELDDKEIK